MKTFLLGLFAFFILSTLIVLFSKMKKQSRTKSSLYKHKSELEPTPMSQVIEPGNDELPDADIEWEN